MSTLAEQFADSRYKSKIEFMTPVAGMINDISFTGRIGNDTVIDEEVGPVFHIFLDSPILINGQPSIHLFCNQTDVTNLTLLTE